MTALPPDPNRRQRAASSPYSSVWVSASAGSGKTKVLTDRVLRLLVGGTLPHRLLCLTFTKAAAAEMAERIHRRLADWVVLTDDDLEQALIGLTGKTPEAEETDRARRLFADVIDTPGGLRIQTIHAFCESLLRRFPIEAACPPHFEVMDDITASALLRDTRRLVLHKVADLHHTTTAATTHTELRGDQAVNPTDKIVAANRDSVLAEALQIVARLVQTDDFTLALNNLNRQRQRLFALNRRAGNRDGLHKLLCKLIGLDVDTDPEQLLATACVEESFDGEALRRAIQLILIKGTKKYTGHAQTMADWLAGDTDTRQADFEIYVGAFLTNNGTIRASFANKNICDADPWLKEALETEAKRLLAVQEQLRAVNAIQANLAFLMLAEAILGRYRTRKHRQGRFDFDDLVQDTLSLLEQGEQMAWVMYKLDGGLDHILVDEAQDTNPEQWRVITALADCFFHGDPEGHPRTQRTLFAVGDPKQTIFGFQGANPGDFSNMAMHYQRRINALTNQSFHQLALDTSFRSCPPVLKFVDEVFQGDLSARIGVSAGKALRHHAHRQGQAGQVSCWPLILPGDEETTGSETETPWSLPLNRQSVRHPIKELADRLADTIAAWTDPASPTYLPSRDDAIRPGDIMVLLRKRTPFIEHLVRALKQHSVPVSGVDRMQLAEQLAVRDLMAMARFMLLPEDDLNLACLLKSPLLGLDDDALMNLAIARPETLWSRLQDSPEHQGVTNWLKTWLDTADRLPAHELFHQLLVSPCPTDPQGSGRRAMLRRLGPDCLDPLDELLGQALNFERLHPPSLQGFVVHFDAGGVIVKREMEDATAGRVRILTVHSAKGLQAPVVVLVDLPGGKEDNTKVEWGEQPRADKPNFTNADNEPLDGVPLWQPNQNLATKAFQNRRDHRRQANADETLRLLYVALTRAEDRLLVCGYRNRRPQPESEATTWHHLCQQGLARLCLKTNQLPKPLPGQPHELEDPAMLEMRTLDYVEVQTAPHQPRFPLPPPRLTRDPLPVWVTSPPPVEPTPSRPLAPSKPQEADPAVQSPLGKDQGYRYHRGRVIHALLEMLPDLPHERRFEAARRYVARPALDLSAAEQTKICDETMAVLDHPEYAALFGPGSLPEVPVVGRTGDHVIQGRIDRLVRLEHDLYIVDYKTNQPPPRKVADVDRAYLRQMAAYRRSLVTIWPDHHIHCLLLWTDGPSLMKLPDNLLNEALVGAKG